MAIDQFFIKGDAKDPAYINVRDRPNLKFAKIYVEKLWNQYSAYADPNFRTDAQNHFLQRFWEMYLTCSFLAHNIKLERIGHEGPEYYIVINNKRVWIEAIAPEAGSGDDKVPVITQGGVYTVPDEQILMRFTHALVEKNNKYKAAVSKGIIKANEPIILAINSSSIPHARFGAEIPYYLKAYLPIGYPQITINIATRESSKPCYQYRPSVSKKNGSIVETTSFLNSEFSHFAAVLHSSVDCFNHPSLLGTDFSILHNPISDFSLPKQFFSWCKQFKFENSELHEL